MIMSKFHINKHGVPVPCKAKLGNCPLGGISEHFDNLEQAQEYVNNQSEQKHGLLPTVKTSNIPDLKTRGMMSSKEVQVVLKTGEIIEGIAGNNKDKKESFILRADGSWRVSKEIKLDDIAELKQVSNKLYFSEEYEKELRRAGKARPEFRYSEKGMTEFKNKFIDVEYDGKTFDGQVIDVHYNGPHDSGLIIKSVEDDSIKHIKTYRLTNLEITSDNLVDHKSYQAMKRLAQEFDVNDFSYIGQPQDSDFVDFTPPRQKIDQYFDAVISKHKGKDIDLNNYNYDWAEEVYDNKDNYRDNSMHQYDYGYGDGQYDEWSENSNEWYEEDIGRAQDLNAFYDERKEFINHMTKEVIKTDWTEYYATQKEGEINMLEYLRVIDIASDY